MIAVRRPSKLVRTTGLGAIDQGLFSVGNLLFYVTLAREATATEFGVVAAAVLSYETSLLATQAIFVQSPSLLLPEVEECERVDLASTAFRFALAVGSVLSLICVGIGWGTSSPLVLVCAAIFLPLFAQKAARSLAFGLGRPGMAVLSDGIWTLLQTAVFLVTLFVSISAEGLIWLWALGAALGALGVAVPLGLVRRPSTPGGIRRLGAGTAGLTKENALSALQTHSIGWLVLLVVGPLGAGALRGVRTLFGPSNAMIAGIRAAGVPAMRGAVASGQGGDLRATSKKLIGAMMSSVLLTGVIVFSIPAHWGRAILGDVAVDAVALTPAFLMMSLFRVPVVAGQMVMLATRAVPELVAARARLALATVLGVSGGAGFDGTRGAILGAAAAIAISLPRWLRPIWRSV